MDPQLGSASGEVLVSLGRAAASSRPARGTCVGPGQ